MNRVVSSTTVKGAFALPLGIRFLGHEVCDHPKSVDVSTVCLEGGQLEDPLGILAPEHGYETMVFLEGCSFFSLFTAKYETREQAADGHKEVVAKLLSRELPLSIPLPYYSVWED